MKKFIYKISLFIVLVFVLQIAAFYLIPEKREFRTELKNLNTTFDKPIDVLCFGSSIIKSTDPSDNDLRSVFKMLADTAKEFKVAGVSGFAFQMDLFKSYCNYVYANAQYKPKLIVAELNLRSFSPEWDLRPEYQFEYEKTMLENPWKARFYRPLSVFKYFQRDFSREYFINSVVDMDGKSVGKVQDFLRVDKMDSNYTKGQYLFHYLYKLNSTHRKVQSVLDIIKIAKQHGSKVLFYVTPIDYKTGEKYWPGDFDKIVSSNISFLKNEITSNGAFLLDLSNTITTEYFSEGQTPEHMKQSGRRFVAEKIAQEVRTLSSQLHL